MRHILFLILFLFSLNSYPAPFGPSTIHAGKVRQTTYIFEDLNLYTFLNMAKQIGISSGFRLTSSFLLTLGELYHFHRNPYKSKIATYTGYSLLWLWRFAVLQGQAKEAYLHLHNKLGTSFCSTRQGRMPFFIKNQWLADRFYFIFESSQKNHPVLWITPIGHSNAQKGQNGIPAWQNLLNILKKRDIQHLGVSIAPIQNKSPNAPAGMELQLISHYHSGHQTTQAYPIEESDKAGNTRLLWDLELMSWLCLPQTYEKIYSLFDSRTIQQLAGLLDTNTLRTLKPQSVDITASGRGYLLAQIKAGKHQPVQLGYSAYGHYVTLEPFEQSASELKRLLSSAQSRLLVASDSRQQAVEWSRPLTMLLQAAANYGAEKTGRSLVRRVDNVLLQNEKKAMSEPVTDLKKAQSVYLNKLSFLVLSTLIVSPPEIPSRLDDVGATLTDDENGNIRSARKQNAPDQQTDRTTDAIEQIKSQASQASSALMRPRLVIEPEASWAQSVFFTISSLGGIPGRVLPDSSVLYGSRGFAVGMQLVYGRFSSQIIPEDWDFMVEKNSLGRLLVKLGLPEEIKASFLTHHNQRSNLFEYTKEWNDGRKMSLKVLAYNIPAHDPKGLRITLYQPGGDEQHPETHQFDLLLVEDLPLHNNVFAPTRMDTSSFYCNTVALPYFLSNWEDMWNRLDRKVLVKALPRIRYWLQEERLQQRLMGTGALQRLENLANQIESFLLPPDGETVVRFGENSQLNQESILHAPSFDITQNPEENQIAIPWQADGSTERNDEFEKANNENEWFFLIQDNNLSRAMTPFGFKGMLLKTFSEENGSTLVFYPKNGVSIISFSGRTLPKKILTSVNIGKTIDKQFILRKGKVIDISTTDKEYDSVDIYPSVYNLESSKNYAPKKTVLAFQSDTLLSEKEPERGKKLLTLDHTQREADSELDRIRFDDQEDEHKTINVKSHLKVSIDIPKSFLLDLKNSYIVNTNNKKIYFDGDSSDVDTSSQSTSDHHDLMTLLVYQRNNEQVTLGFVKSSSKVESGNAEEEILASTSDSIVAGTQPDILMEYEDSPDTLTGQIKPYDYPMSIANAIVDTIATRNKGVQKRLTANNVKPKRTIQKNKGKKEKPNSLKGEVEAEVVAIPEPLLATETDQVSAVSKSEVPPVDLLNTAAEKPFSSSKQDDDPQHTILNTDTSAKKDSETVTDVKLNPAPHLYQASVSNSGHPIKLNKKTELIPRHVKKQTTKKKPPSKTPNSSSTPDLLVNQNMYKNIKYRMQKIKDDIASTEKPLKIERYEYASLKENHDTLINEYHKTFNPNKPGTSTLEKKMRKVINDNNKLLDKKSNNIDMYEKKIKNQNQELETLSERFKKMKDSIELSINTVENFKDKDNISDKELLSFFVQYAKFDEAYLLFLNFWSKPKENSINSFLLKILEVAAWRNHDALNHLIKLSATYQLDNNIAMLKTFRIFKIHGERKGEQPGKPLIFADNILQEILNRLLKNQVDAPVTSQGDANHAATDYINIWQALVDSAPYNDIQEMIEKSRSCSSENDNWLTLSLKFLETVNHLEHGVPMAFSDDVTTTYLRWLYEPDLAQKNVLMTRLKQLIPHELPQEGSNLQLPVEAVLDVAITSSDENVAEAIRFAGLALQLAAQYQGLPTNSPLLSKVIANRYLWGNQKALFSLALLLSDEPEYGTLSQQLLDTLTIPDFREEPSVPDAPMKKWLRSKYWFNEYSLETKKYRVSDPVYMNALCCHCLTGLIGIEQYLCNNRYCGEDYSVFCCSRCILKEDVVKSLKCMHCEKALSAMINTCLKKGLKAYCRYSKNSWRPLLSEED